MKLSEAILLGSTVLAAKPGRQYFSENEGGCALGMAAIAKGWTFQRVYRPIPAKDRRTLGVEGAWGDWIVAVVPRPCHCWRFRVPREMPIKEIIAHLFDYHVMGKKNWTINELVAWVKTVEPPAEEPVVAGLHQRVPRAAFGDNIARWRNRIEERQREMDDWQQVRQSFESRSTAREKTRRSG